MKEDSGILDKGKELLQMIRDLASARYDLEEKTREGNGLIFDNFSVKQHEEVWSRMLGCLDQELAVQEIMQAGLSSTRNDEGSNNLQVGQQVVM